MLINAGFLSWLLDQIDRNDNVGNFAVTVKNDEGVPTDNSIKESWLSHLNLRGACKETIIDFEQAWSEFTRIANITDKKNDIQENVVSCHHESE